MPNLRAELEELRAKALWRERRIVEEAQGPRLKLDGREYLSFCSNDYLGLANHPALIEAAQWGARDYGVGGAASHLISGHSAAHHRLEEALAEFVGLPRALYFSSGYMANTGVIPALVGRGDTVLSDQLNHASIIDGVRLSRASVEIYPHADLDRLEQQLRTCSGGRKLIVSDCVFSMDGDLAPISRLTELCERYDAWLLLDDAHGFGVLGAQGRGALAHFGIQSPNIIYMGTLGKAAGVCGAFVAGQTDVIDWLIQRARTYVFTTAAPPLLACALLASLDLIARDEWRREHLRALVARLREGLREFRWQLLPSDSAIQPLIIGDNARAMGVMQSLFAQGIWVPAIRPPTVPEGSARLRISLSAAHGLEDVERLVGALRSLDEA